jgi:hypothetical protein
MREKLRQNSLLYIAIGLVFAIFLILFFWGIGNILQNDTCTNCAIYKAIGFGIIMLWTCIFLIYFIWASHFYNINYGITNKDWDKIYKAKEQRTEGGFYKQEDIDEEPQYNPYSDQTFGLPPGTVRGMIAFTLLFGSLALLVVSFGLENSWEPGSFIVDQFEFFKTAFIMMIAFYFGSHSLKYLKKDKGETPSTVLNSKTAQNMKDVATSADTDQKAVPKSEVVVINADDPLAEKSDEGVDIPPIRAIDPMAPKKS